MKSLQYILHLTHAAPDVDEDEANKHELAYHRQTGVITVAAENNHADQEKTPALYLNILTTHVPFYTKSNNLP